MIFDSCLSCFHAVCLPAVGALLPILFASVAFHTIVPILHITPLSLSFPPSLPLPLLHAYFTPPCFLNDPISLTLLSLLLLLLLLLLILLLHSLIFLLLHSLIFLLLIFLLSLLFLIPSVLHEDPRHFLLPCPPALGRVPRTRRSS
jgi:hypothetical protein